jgi:hypothetical protein
VRRDRQQRQKPADGTASRFAARRHSIPRLPLLHG